MLYIECPYCGLRSQNEFAYGGDGTVKRPELNQDISDEKFDEVMDALPDVEEAVNDSKIATAPKSLDRSCPLSCVPLSSHQLNRLVFASLPSPLRVRLVKTPVSFFASR